MRGFFGAAAPEGGSVAAFCVAAFFVAVFFVAFCVVAFFVVVFVAAAIGTIATTRRALAGTGRATDGCAAPWHLRCITWSVLIQREEHAHEPFDQPPGSWSDQRTRGRSEGRRHRPPRCRAAGSDQGRSRRASGVCASRR